MKWTISLLVLFIGIQNLRAQETVKMIRVNDQPILSGKINGKKAYFLIDTGSDVSILNSADAKRFNFKYIPISIDGYRLSGLSSQHHNEILIAKNANIILAGIELKVCYKVFDLTHIIESIWEDTGVRINGIIGSDLMKKYHFMIDYPSKEVSFKDHR